MNITSPIFVSGGMIPPKFTCEGEDVFPSLHISDPPDGTQSLCIIMHDHDAPSGDFGHWLIWNIDPSVRNIEEHTTVVGATEGTNDFGSVGWGGPCPPSGTHRYEFHLYALSTSLDLPESTIKEELRKHISAHILEEASIVALYSKSGG